MDRLRRFVCSACERVEMVRGGTTRFLCSQCRPPEPPQYLAHQAVGRAIRKGELAHPSAFECVDCDAPAVFYDHRDYSRPLDVQPVCRRCNVRRGAALNHPARRAARPEPIPAV